MRQAVTRVSVLRWICAASREAIHTFTAMSQYLDLPSESDRDEPSEEINQPPQNADISLPDAFGAAAPTPGDQGGSRGADRAPATAAPDLDIARLTPRDIAVVRHLVCLRLLTYEQLHRIALQMPIARSHAGVWGLSNYVIAQHGAKADELRQVLRAWYDYTNPAGYSGDVCYDGGCNRAFHDNRCGGMSESNLVL